jgi:hypothetical protein
MIVVRYISKRDILANCRSVSDVEKFIRLQLGIEPRRAWFDADNQRYCFEVETAKILESTAEVIGRLPGIAPELNSAATRMRRHPKEGTWPPDVIFAPGRQPDNEPV